MDQQILKNILEKHRKWILGESDGERANLTRANLTRADLTRADLTEANLTEANLYGANLYGANLTRANLTRADLTEANLTRADLTRADLTEADLTRANLTEADLYGANLYGANLTVIKKDFFERLLKAKNEVAGLYDAIQRGKIDGSCYEGECCCFVGTIAKVAHCAYADLPELKPDASSATEKWFMGISPGQIPMSNSIVRLTAEWLEEFCKENSIKLPKYEITATI